MSAIACVLLGRPAELEPWAAAAALVLAQSRGAGVVLRWSAERDDERPWSPADALPALRACVAAASRLAELGVDAAAHGRLVIVELPRDDALAAAAAERVADAAAAPCVLAMSGVRDEAFDRLLDGAQRVGVVGDPDGPLTALVVAGLTDSGFHAVRLAPVGGGAALAARAGLAAPATLRRGLEPLLGGTS